MKYDQESIWNRDFLPNPSPYVPLGEDGVALLEFVAFWINPLLSQNDCKHKLKQVISELKSFMEPFSSMYPFLGVPMELKLRFHDGRPYIYGSQEVPDSLDEELLRTLLWKFSHKFHDLWIHLSDDDYYICQNIDNLPSWLSSKISCNRIWINWQRVLAIPSEFCENSSVPLNEAILILENKAYKMEILDTLEPFFKIDGITKALSSLVDMKITLDDRIASFFYKNRYVLGKSLWKTVETDLSTGNVKGMDNDTTGSKNEYTVAIPNWLKDFPNLSQVIQNGFNQLLEEDASICAQYSNHSETHMPILERGHLMDILIAKNYINTYIPSVEFEKPTKNYSRDEVLIKKMKELFDDKDLEKDLQEIDPSSDDEDKKIIEEFKSQGVSIDEDDFFEFFLRDALKIKQEELHQFINTDYNDVSDYTSDEEEFKR